MWKKFATIGAIVLAVAVVMVWAVPALAQQTSAPPVTQNTTQPAYKARVLLRLLLIQDEKKVDTLIARAESSGKITADQAVKIKEFWTAHHKQFLKNVVLTRLIWAQDQSKVQAFLDKAVTAGKIQQEQADKLMKLWQYLHTN